MMRKLVNIQQSAPLFARKQMKKNIYIVNVFIASILTLDLFLCINEKINCLYQANNNKENTYQ